MGCTSCNKSKINRIKSITKAVIAHPKRIVKAYYHLIVKNEDIEKVAFSRLNICYSCNDKLLIAKIAGKQCWICSDCSCPLETKTRDMKEYCSKW
jgi:ribosomal protein L37AE/L43A